MPSLRPCCDSAIPLGRLKCLGYGHGFGAKSKFIAKRRDTVQESWGAIEVILVCGTPCSGKSTPGYVGQACPETLESSLLHT